MIPIIELRGAIPIGIAKGLNPFYLYMACLVGSTSVAIPIILTFRYIIEFCKKKKLFIKFINFVDRKIHARAKKLKTFSIIGIILFVGIPLPTTGSWSAAAIASLFQMRIKDALIGIFLGNAIAGILVLALSLHII
jgi:uncharacterized membrane protein